MFYKTWNGKICNGHMANVVVHQGKCIVCMKNPENIANMEIFEKQML